MTWKPKLALLLMALPLFLSQCADEPEVTPLSPPAPPDTIYHSLEHVLSIEALADEWDNARTLITLIDVRKPEAFAKGHLPRAVNIPRASLQDTTYDFKGMARPKAELEELFTSAGIDESSHLVIYDAKGGSDAARLWFLLKYYGHENSSLLDGGLTAWEAAGHPLDTITSDLYASKPFVFQDPPHEEILVDREGVLASLKDTNVVLIDTRTPDEYTGKRQKKGASACGRIAGSLLWDWGNAVHLSETGLLKSAKDLRYMLDSCGIAPEKEVIVYCHTGTRSAHTYFVLTELMGFQNVRNYDGSWTEWSRYPELPQESDYAEPVILQ